MDSVRIGIVGVGGMGSNHAGYLYNGQVNGAELTAVADIKPSALKRIDDMTDGEVMTFDSADEMLAADCVDAVMIATPHYDHPPIGIKAFEHDLHVLSEKPVGVYTKQARELNEAADKSGNMFAVMFQQRTSATHQKLKDLIESGELGELKRNAWIITSWYRSQSYYNSGGWRATWAGEGGGVLLNQCPHNLDLWQWFCGVPTRVRAFCNFGRYHDIEVEDDVTAYVEYEDGSTGMFVTSTGEAPGTNMFEIAGDNGRLVMEGGNLTFYRNRTPEREFNREYTGGFGSPENWRCDIPAGGGGGGHAEVTQRWVNAILQDDPDQMVADGREGIKGLEISNAMLMSTWIDDWVELPLDEDRYYELLQERIETSDYEPGVEEDEALDVEDSWH
ncbi:MAG: Gfo/Idh/MocA family protein [Planctomycetota bacterium]